MTVGFESECVCLDTGEIQVGSCVDKSVISTYFSSQKRNASFLSSVVVLPYWRSTNWLFPTARTMLYSRFPFCWSISAWTRLTSYRDWYWGRDCRPPWRERKNLIWRISLWLVVSYSYFTFCHLSPCNLSKNCLIKVQVIPCNDCYMDLKVPSKSAESFRRSAGTNKHTNGLWLSVIRTACMSVLLF